MLATKLKREKSCLGPIAEPDIKIWSFLDMESNKLNILEKSGKPMVELLEIQWEIFYLSYCYLTFLICVRFNLCQNFVSKPSQLLSSLSTSFCNSSFPSLYDGQDY